MARLLLTHIVGAPDLEPEVSHMTFASNAWVLEHRGDSQWLIEAPDVHAFHVCMLPGWAVTYAPADDAASDDDVAGVHGDPAQQPSLI